MTQRVTRLAPSPTGALHLGNARTFLINYAHARQRGQRVVLRVEDLDGPRLKPGADTLAVDLLRWLGMDWDTGPLSQRADLTPYQAPLNRLHEQGLIYPCSLSRKEAAAALSAPHAKDGEARYAGTSRDRVAPAPPELGVESEDNFRVRVPDEQTSFVDGFTGPQTGHVQREVGDFLVTTKAGVPSYQFAVVVDDARQGVTDVVRGDDLIPSTHRQLWLQRLLNLPTPAYWHVPLVLGPDRRRLAKRHGDTRLDSYRRAGVTPERVIGALAKMCGVADKPEPMPIDRFVEAFDWDTLPKEPAVWTDEMEAWLTAR